MVPVAFYFVEQAPQWACKKVSEIDKFTTLASLRVASEAAVYEL